ncbi:MAG: glutathione-dependent reductase [Rhodospirillaceae bacterium]|nr:glutathione-dependent reductase [Rhodospirillaceae bacterium]
MKTLIEGVWTDRDIEKPTPDGSFARKESIFRNWITVDGKPGITGKGGFKAESGRYHLYVSLACPWAHRVMIFRQLKGLNDHITASIVHPLMLEKGWELRSDYQGTTGDPVLGKSNIYEVYLAADQSVTSRASVPVLWDRETKTIVSNESSEIIRMFNWAFNKITGNAMDYYPQKLRADIDLVNTDIYNDINNGVYKTGFSKTQAAYSKSYSALFRRLDKLEKRLSLSRYLIGDRITEADWRLFTTLIRFDAVYFGHFKCNYKRIVDYPSLWAYTRELFQLPGISSTVDLDHIKTHYYGSHLMLNPYGIIPSGPEIDFYEPFDRTNL